MDSSNKNKENGIVIHARSKTGTVFFVQYFVQTFFKYTGIIPSTAFNSYYMFKENHEFNDDDWSQITDVVSGVNFNHNHIVHIRDFRDMICSDYLGSLSDPHGPFEENKKVIRDQCSSISEFAVFKERPSVWGHGYSFDFFKNIMCKEFDSLITYMNENNNVKIVYYEDMVTDFWKYLCDMNILLQIDNDKLVNIYNDLKDSFIPDGIHKRHVVPQEYKKLLTPELSMEFAKIYKQYDFLHRYID